MISPPCPVDERERLADLQNYRILDTPSEMDYDDITLLASTICQTPISLISLVDEHRQWFKSRHGLSVSETSRDISFCGHTILQRQVFEVPDALSDSRFADNPLVTGEPHIGFYAGAPLLAPSGRAIGTLCVLDRKAQKLSDRQKVSLQALARLVVDHLEMRKLLGSLKENNDLLQMSNKTVFSQQQKLFHAAKMQSLGEMAAGIAHEINNPLAIISSSARILMNRAERCGYLGVEESVNRLQTIEQTTHRISKIIHGLLTFAREDEKREEKQLVTLRSIIDDSLTFVGEILRNHGVSLEIGPIPSCQIDCQPAHISQIIVNLLNNSRDAAEESEDKWIKLDFEYFDSTVEIRISDSGRGIPMSVREKIMQPFFTTKPIGKGTGLGLSIAKGIAEMHRGNLRLDADAPHTTFILSLPINCSDASF